jgi:hypothetical protein
VRGGWSSPISGAPHLRGPGRIRLFPARGVGVDPSADGLPAPAGVLVHRGHGPAEVSEGARRDFAAGTWRAGVLPGNTVTVIGAGGPDRTRTCGLRFRKPLLCPAELRDRVARSIPQIARNWSLREGSNRAGERSMIRPFASRLQDVDTGHKERQNVGWRLPVETQPITFSRFHRKLSRSLMPSPARHARSAPRPIALKAGQRAGHWGAAWRYRVVY